MTIISKFGCKSFISIVTDRIMIEQVLHYWYIVLPAFIIFHWIVSAIHTNSLRRKLGAKPFTHTQLDGFMDLNLAVIFLKLKGLVGKLI